MLDTGAQPRYLPRAIAELLKHPEPFDEVVPRTDVQTSTYTLRTDSDYSTTSAAFDDIELESFILGYDSSAPSGASSIYTTTSSTPYGSTPASSLSNNAALVRFEDRPSNDSSIYRSAPSSSPYASTPVSPSCVDAATFSFKHLKCYERPFFLPRSPRSIPVDQVSDLEAHCFSHFAYKTGPQFASYFDSTMWRRYTSTLALSHPVLFACAVALGAVHRRFNYGISREAFEYCAHAARFQTRAKRMLNQLKSQERNQKILGHTTFSAASSSLGSKTYRVDDRDVIMASEMLLGLYEGFQSNYEQAVQHMNEGINYLIDRPMKLEYSQNTHCPFESSPIVIARFFQRCKTRAEELFGTAPIILARYDSGAPLPPMPGTFENLEQARDLVFTEVEWLMQTPTSAWSSPTQRSAAQQLHVSRMLKWSAAYANIVGSMERTDVQKQACMLMKLTKNMTYLLLYLTFYVNVFLHDRDWAADERRRLLKRSMADGQFDVEEFLEQSVLEHPSTCDCKNDGLNSFPKKDDGTTTIESFSTDLVDDKIPAYANPHLWTTISSREELLSNLCRVKILGEAILDPTNMFAYIEHSVSFDSAIGPPLKPSPVPESSGKTRHLVKNLMERPRIYEFQESDDEKQWEWLGVYGVAEHVSAIEEHAVISAVRSKIPAEVNPRWVDITCFMETRRLLLRYCSPGEDGLGMRWTQEWWSF